MTAKTTTKAREPKILSVKFRRPVAAPVTAQRIRASRDNLDLKDVGERGFALGQYGVGYGDGEKRYLVPWSNVDYLITESPKKAKPAAKDDAGPAES